MYLVSEEEYMKLKKIKIRSGSRRQKKHQSTPPPLDQKVLIKSLKNVREKSKWQKYK